MMKYKTCGADIAKSAKVCPHCGAKNKKPIFKQWWFWVLVVFIVLIVTVSPGGDNTTVGYQWNSEYKNLSRNDYMGQCVTASYGLTYSEVARNPDYYTGNLIAVTGKVIQVLENGQDVQLRLQEESSNWEDDFTWYVFYTLTEGEGRILEGDNMTAYGECVGTVSYEAVFGNTVTIPAIIMKYHS